MRLSGFLVIWLLCASSVSFAGNYTCHECNDALCRFFCLNCARLRLIQGARLRVDDTFFRLAAISVGGVEVVDPVPAACSCADAFNLTGCRQSFQYESGDERFLTVYLGWLLPHSISWHNSHHLLVLARDEGWLKIYLYVETPERIYVQIQGAWLFFSGREMLIKWFSLFLNNTGSGEAWAYTELQPDYSQMILPLSLEEQSFGQ